MKHVRNISGSNQGNFKNNPVDTVVIEIAKF